MKINVKFHAALVALNKEGQFAAELQVKAESGQILTIWSDTFFDPFSALQALTQALGEAQS